jgi:hypothetical protein
MFPTTCSNKLLDADELGMDCGGSCAPCEYKIKAPNPDNADKSGCEANGTGFMCPRSMVFSSEMQQAAFDDFGASQPFVYGVVGHDPDPTGVDGSGASYSATCCQCYQLVFTKPTEAGVSAPIPKPLIVQAFNTYAGGPTAFDVYMGVGGYGTFNGCTKNGQLYSAYPDTGGDWNGGVRATRYSQCGSTGNYNEGSIGASGCQSYVASECAKIGASALVEATTEQSCVATNRSKTHYHMNWNVLVKRVECPEGLTRVTGCKLASQSLPAADPAVQTEQQATQAGFKSGYHTTTMQDCCRPTCAWNANVKNTTGGYGRFYTCSKDGKVD